MTEYENVYHMLKDKTKLLYNASGKVISTNSENVGTLKENLTELPHQFFSIKDPTSIIFNLPSYKTQPWWLVGELLTEFLNLNPPLMNKYRADLIEDMYSLTPQGTCEYLYGTRWAEHNQLEDVRRRLTENPHSKRAIIQTWMPYDGGAERKDAPCNIAYMFLVTTTALRSNKHRQHQQQKNKNQSLHR